MPACPVPAAAAAAAALLCPAMMMLLLPLLLLASPTPAVAALNTSTPCAPASCGKLTVAYPFWLDGTHPPECGYKAFQVTCDKQAGNLSLANSYWRYQLQDIFYENSSFTADLSGAPCDLQNFVNPSSDLGLSPFNISSKNLELFILYDCHLGRRRAPPPSWTRVRCPPAPPDDDPDSSPVFALLGNKYTPGGIATPPPTNYCAVSMIPVLGYEGATGADYQRLLQGGSLLEYTDAGACKACRVSGGHCRVDASDDAFKCYCTDGNDAWFVCGEFCLCL